MIMHITEAIMLNEFAYCSIEHLVEISGLSLDDLEDLIANEIIRPMDEDEQPRRFQLQHVVTVKAARRLRDDFQLDRNGLALALTLLRRIDELKQELIATKAENGHLS